ncbi:hypothetical protein ZWY2020_009046 [Hordeum vulgare]|nr:hypothetical protein ZWY2020_009046 [Hordeum vulgare]
MAAEEKDLWSSCESRPGSEGCVFFKATTLLEMDRGKSLLEEQARHLDAVEKETQQLPKDITNNLDIFHDEAEVLKELEAGRHTANFYSKTRFDELSVICCRITEAIHNKHILLKWGDTETGSQKPTWAQNEVEEKEMTKTGMEDKTKSLTEKQVIDSLTRETGMEGKSGKQQQTSQLLPCSPGIQRNDEHIELEVNKQKQMTEDDIDIGESARELTMEEEMAAEEEDFARYRSHWESRWGSKGGCGFFKGTTQLSSMHFTYLTPKPSLDDGIVADTLQIFSIKLAEIKGDFKWPLSVYGVVAARDSVDHNRNLLFCRSRTRSQIVRQNDPFLRLIGPTRAILFKDPVDFEIQLKVKCGAMSGDRALISATHCYRTRHHDVHTVCFENRFCKIELCMDLLVETIQVTICSIRVVKQGIRQRVERRCRVACSTTSYSRKIIDGKTTYVANASSGEVVLLDPGRHATPQGSEGYLDLSRRVVSVEHEGNLELVVQAYSSSGDITAQGHVSLAPRSFGFSQKNLYVDDAQLEITVAWSFLVADKDTLVRPVGI